MIIKMSSEAPVDIVDSVWPVQATRDSDGFDLTIRWNDAAESALVYGSNTPLGGVPEFFGRVVPSDRAYAAAIDYGIAFSRQVEARDLIQSMPAVSI